MYADRYAEPNRFNPVGLTAAIAINGAVIAALMFAAPHVVRELPDDPLKIIDVFTPPPPPPEPEPKPVERAATQPTEAIPVPKTVVPTISDFPLPETLPTPPLPPLQPIPATGSGTAIDSAPPAPLPFVEPGIDPRYASQLQPEYPAAERRAEREGRVTIRVLVGVDGHVKQAERVSATSDAFWQATLRQTARWRFKPATRGGIPVEAWRRMSLTFVLEN